MVSGSPPPTFDDYWHAAFIFLLVVYLLWTSLSMLYKLIKGTPAIALTNRQLILNTKNIIINWPDIISVRIGGSRSSYLVIELKDQSKYFPNSLMRKIHTFLSISLNSNEFALGLALVLGDNDEILETINKFHEKHKA
jgi:hypothetical protein